MKSKLIDKIRDEISEIDNIWKDKTKELLDIKGKPLNVKYILDKDIEEVYGFEYYQIITSLKINIETFSKRIFPTFVKVAPVNLNNTKGISRFERFVNQFLIDQKDFSRKAGIDHTRLNKLLKGDRNDFYAYEVYNIATSEKIKVKSAFDQLYKKDGKI